jgi:hypothetical protein
MIARICCENTHLTDRGDVMQNHLLRTLAAGALSLAAACAAQPRATVQAARVERVQCDASSTSQDDLVRSIAVLHVQPIYSQVGSTGSTEERVNGATLVVRPPKGVSADQLTRILQCHSARVLLGQLNGDAVRNDPYWLPDTWVNIGVRPENGNFTVTISADTVRDNLQVYSRANHYADDHMVATDPGLP